MNAYQRWAQGIQPRFRVLIDNDFAGDPDDLFQLTHHLLSPSVEIVGIISSHLGPGDPFDNSGQSAAHGRVKVHEILHILGLEGKIPIWTGSEEGLAEIEQPHPTEASRAIIREALRTDTALPLFVVCGAGFTDLASAYLEEPSLATKLTVIWIGGPEHPRDRPQPPGISSGEYNWNIDRIAGQTIFNLSSLPLWQVPRDTYRTCLMPLAEMETRVRSQGGLGFYLAQAIDHVVQMTADHGFRIGEAYVLGDQPLVTLTVLQTAFEPTPASSRFEDRPRPTLNDDGTYGPPRRDAFVRVFTEVDFRGTLEDFYAKLALWNRP